MHDQDGREDAAIEAPGAGPGQEPVGARAAGDDDALDTFRALAHPARLVLLRILLDGERTVSELASATGLRQPAASLHLARLRDGGLVRRRSESRQVFYALSRDPTMRLLVRIACGGHTAPGRALARAGQEAGRR